MNNLLNRLNNYFYLDAKLKEFSSESLKGVPFGIKSQYHMHLLSISQIDCLVLETHQQVSINALRKHLDLFDQALHMPCLLYIPHIKQSFQRFLLENRIAFATKDSLYFPQLLIHLKEGSVKESRLHKNKKLSKLAQMILTYVLVKQINTIEIDVCARQFNVTKMSAGRSLNELHAFGFMTLQSMARKKIYSLLSSIDLDMLLGACKSPFDETCYIRPQDIQWFDSRMPSSYTALSHYANIVTTQSCYAIEKDHFQSIVKNHHLKTFDERYDHDMIELQLWHFNPLLIQQHYVDPLSLYLSLKDKIDPEDSRVLNAVSTLEEMIQGLLRDTRSH